MGDDVPLRGQVPPEGVGNPDGAGPQIAFEVLGPTRVWRDGIELDLGPPQQATLLTLLLVGVGRPISTSEMIDLIWGDEMPSSALNILHKYVGTLRRILEPDLAPRAVGSYIHRRGSSYLLDLGGMALDLVDFRRQLDAARTAMIDGNAEVAVDASVRGLQLWRGPAGDGLAWGSRATTLFAGINEEFLRGCVEAAEVAIPQGRVRNVLQPLRLAAWMAPYHEEAQAALVLALAASGQQADALSVYESVRVRLVDELGIDPGPTLREAHQQVLRQVAMTPPVRVQLPDQLSGPEREPDRPTPPEPGADELVGRRAELALLRNAVDSAFFAQAGCVVVEGPPGVGKTRLLLEATSEATARGAFSVWGRCQEGGGAPSMWPWVQIASALVEALPVDGAAAWTDGVSGLLRHLDGDAPSVSADAGVQFRLYEGMGKLLATVAARQPLVVVVDDLHWGDSAAIAMFSHLAESLPPQCVLVAAMRDRAPAQNKSIKRMLADVARYDRHRRITLGPIEPSEVAELVRRETGRAPSADVARSIQARTEGNPFFVKELARYLANEGDLTDDAAAQAAVPATVRDIVRDRMSRFADDDRRLLETAALIGRDIDVRLLSDALGVDPTLCMERLENVVELGLVEFSESGLWRFAHDLVREAVIRSTSRTDASRLHLSIAEALAADAGPAERVEALAYHLQAARPLVEPQRVVGAFMAAGRVAAARSAYDNAERDFGLAAAIASDVGVPELELTALTELAAVAGIHEGLVGASMTYLDRAEEMARRLGREQEAAAFVLSQFLASAQGIRIEESGRLARRLLEFGSRSSHPVVQATGHLAWGIHQWSTGQIGEACRHLERSQVLIRDRRDVEPLRQRLQMVTPAMLALNTALHGELDEARRQFAALEDAAWNDPYAISIWGSFAVTAAAVSGDVPWTRDIADKTIAADPDFTFAFSGVYPRLARHWAAGLSDPAPAVSASEMEHLIDGYLRQPLRSNLATWHALRAEVYLACGEASAALAALDEAEAVIASYGERYAQCLVLLLRARAMALSGDATAAVRAVAEKGLVLARDTEAQLFATRIEQFVAELPPISAAG
jgi:DNA-binding SARP family transcriptional activator/tetratricopeptide (TPR) repeat protein